MSFEEFKDFYEKIIEIVKDDYAIESVQARLSMGRCGCSSCRLRSVLPYALTTEDMLEKLSGPHGATLYKVWKAQNNKLP